MASSCVSWFGAGAAMMLAASCAQEQPQPTLADYPDPLIQQALNDPLMIDPDLASGNEANAALTISFDSSLPAINFGPDAETDMRQAMRDQLLQSGQALRDLPAASKRQDIPDLSQSLSAGERAHNIAFARTCALSLDFSAIWAARLPEHAKPLPGSVVWEAAGAKTKQCHIQVVSYITPLSPDDALLYHFNLAMRAKLKPVWYDGSELAMAGSNGDGSLAAHMRPLPDGYTQVDIIARQIKAQ